LGLGTVVAASSLSATVVNMSETEGGGIVVSYRRQESSHIAGRLYDRLADRFGSARVFIDVDAIEPGVDFAEAITRAVTTCEVLLAIIGPHWLDAMDERGGRRLEDPDDFVRLEIEAALTRNVRVIPILVEGASMPDWRDLPESLAGLVRRNAFIVRHESFAYDAERLVTVIEAVIGTRRGAQSENTAQQEPHPKQSVPPKREWQLELVEDAGAEKTFRLSSGEEVHEIMVRLNWGASIIEVDGLREVQEVFEGQAFPLKTLSSNIGSAATIRVECGRFAWKRIKSLILEINDQTLEYHPEVK
jgi:hypothetical protein